MKNKFLSDFLHTKLRAKERYNLDIDKYNYSYLIRLIQEGKSIAKKKQTNTRTRHLLNVAGRLLHVVYSSETKSIVTVLPKNKAVDLLSTIPWK